MISLGRDDHFYLKDTMNKSFNPYAVVKKLPPCVVRGLRCALCGVCMDPDVCFELINY